MKVVVVGGNGELGSYLCPALIDIGHQVVSVSLDDNEPYTKGDARWNQIETHLLSRDANSVNQFCESIVGFQPDVVIDGSCFELAKCKALVDAVKKTKIKHYIHIGNIHAYGTDALRPWTEDGGRGSVHGVFGFEQKKMEEYVMAAHQESNFPATVLLLSDLVGKGWCPINCQGLYDPIVFKAMKTGGWIMIPSQTGVVQFCRVEDAVEAVKACIAKGDSVVGQTFNITTSPISVLQYAVETSKTGFDRDPDLRQRKWMDMSYALDKTTLAAPELWVAPEACDNIYRRNFASNQKATEVLGITFHGPIQTIVPVARWIADTEEIVSRPRRPIVSRFLGTGREEFLASEEYQGKRECYIYKDGRHGRGYYIDFGPFVEWQSMTWRRLREQQVKMGMDSEHISWWEVFKYFILPIIFWITLFLISTLFFEGFQGMLVYMSWVSNMFSSLPREPPRPFTANVILNTSDYAELSVWHNMLPMRGYLANYTKEETQIAAKHCRTLVYFHGNAENRNKQAWKLAWYAKKAGANVLTFDYRGFGDSLCPKIPFAVCPTEAGIYEDAYSVFDFLTSSPESEKRGLGIDPSCIIFHGHSFGSSVATRLAAFLTSRGKAPGGLILESPFTEVLDVSMESSMSPFSYLPSSFNDIFKPLLKSKLKHKFQQVKFIKNVSSPVLFLHGEKDKIVPATMSSKLYKIRESEQTLCIESDVPCSDLLMLPTADHDTVMKGLDAQGKVLDFVSKVWKSKKRRK